MPAIVQPSPGTPLAASTHYQTARTNRHGDVALTVLDGDYAYVAVHTLGSACEAAPWCSEQGWQARVFRPDGRPARFRRIRLVVTTMRAEGS